MYDTLNMNGLREPRISGWAERPKPARHMWHRAVSEKLSGKKERA
jgi:hypothetical protein